MNLNEEPEFIIGSDGSFLLYTFSNGMLSSFDTAGHLTAQEPLALLTEKFAADSDGQVWFIADTEERAALQAVGSEKQVPISGISNGLPVLCYGADESDVLYMTDTTALYRVPLQTGAAEKSQILRSSMFTEDSPSAARRTAALSLRTAPLMSRHSLRFVLVRPVESRNLC